MSLQAIPSGFWPVGTRRAAASSVVPVIRIITGTPCVLAALGAREAGQHYCASFFFSSLTSVLSEAISR